MEVSEMNCEQQKYVGWEAVQTPVPRLRIRTDEGEHFLIPWHMISLIKADLSLKMIELHTVSGLLFSIVSRESLQSLLSHLQVECVRAVFPADGVKIELRTPEEAGISE